MLFLKEKLHLEPASLVMRMQLVDVPWLFKPVYAWISDNYPLGGYRRKSYIVLFSFYCALMWFLMPAAADHTWLFFVFWFLENMFLCIGDVAMDAFIVERVKKEERGWADRGKLQARCGAARSVGRCAASLLGALVLAERVARTEIFYLTAIAPMLVGLSGFMLSDPRVAGSAWAPVPESAREKPPGARRGYGGTLLSIRDAFLRTDLWKFCILASLYTIAPTPAGGYFYYYTDRLHLPRLTLQFASFFRELGLLAGTLLYNARFRHTPPRTLMTASTVAVASFMVLHAIGVFLPPFRGQVACIFAYEFATALADVFLFLPLLVLGSHLCPDGAEGTSFALVLSIENLGGFVDSFLAWRLMNLFGISSNHLDRLWYMSFLCAYLFLVPLLLLHILPSRQEKDDRREGIDPAATITATCGDCSALGPKKD